MVLKEKLDFWIGLGLTLGWASLDQSPILLKAQQVNPTAHLAHVYPTWTAALANDGFSTKQDSPSFSQAKNYLPIYFIFSK